MQGWRRLRLRGGKWHSLQTPPEAEGPHQQGENHLGSEQQPLAASDSAVEAQQGDAEKGRGGDEDVASTSDAGEVSGRGSGRAEPSPSKVSAQYQQCNCEWEMWGRMDNGGFDVYLLV